MRGLQAYGYDLSNPDVMLKEQFVLVLRDDNLRTEMNRQARVKAYSDIQLDHAGNY